MVWWWVWRISSKVLAMSGLGTIVTAMVTPFDGEGAVDLGAARRLAAHLVANGSDGIVVTGTTGESPTLDDAEKLKLYELVLDEVGERATVIASTGSNDTAHSVRLTEESAALGVDGHLIVTPYYNKPPRQGIIEHFKAVAAATEKPVMIYNIPSRCVINLEPELLAELSQVENITSVKQANSDLDQARRILDDSGLELYAGDDNLLCTFMGMGGSGGVCVSSHVVGNEMKEMAQAAQAGDLERAREIEASIEDVFSTLFITSGTITTKAALKLMGLDAGGVRLPLVEASADETSQVRAMLERHGLITKVAV